MKAMLCLRHIKVENANAIAGLTYGFPAISNFLGFSHALSRALQHDHGLTLGGCAVVCHQHQIHAVQPAGWGDYVFALTRNPLTKEAKTAAFNEEGRMNLDVSLLIECEFSADDLDFFDAGETSLNVQCLEQYLYRKAQTLRLAGGHIVGLQALTLSEVPEGDDEFSQWQRRQLLRLLPGFALVERSDVLHKHHQTRVADDADAQLIDSWLDFAALKYQAIADADADDAEVKVDKKVKWQYLAKPAAGYLVPITIGYHAISPLYANGDVASTRDATTPFRFVESAYSIGQWISPHRAKNISDLFWRYHVSDEAYLCKNQDV
ncbi:type I-F CRISPR-associated protein Csy2 [Deefgea sp. CFH1-16]|uniref:type I-F CRISPR-associated protein Csy2 n=1 Tax=Deefgea sp. CFH1-16 TaxID=2675457 RepID=UPI0015F70983|nr:type I-F CRISPR-associated protein Csy2 [Deefgea sp. CFH1-16]MBM5575627.1 type I-F CRISPR-associated protein Csy2 [Deefgea sp. CFH1-16]